MSDSDQKLLDDQMDAVYSHIVEWVERIDAGTYDDEDNGDGSIYDYPLEVVREVGKPYSVLITCGGPHIEVEAHGYGDARLMGYWGSKSATRHDYGNNPLTTFLDFFIERDDT